MRSSSNNSSTGRQPDRTQTVDPQCNRGNCPAGLYVVGIGPGSANHLTHRAKTVLEQVDAVAGYGTYIDLIRPLIGDKQIISTGMTREVERVEKAIELARSGTSCAIVSSGDPGIYAMAGLVFETCQIKNIRITPLAQDQKPDETLYLEVVPGIPALSAGAALLGGPLTHDFAAISLSDLLTPWELIDVSRQRPWLIL